MVAHTAKETPAEREETHGRQAEKGRKAQGRPAAQSSSPVGFTGSEGTRENRAALLSDTLFLRMCVGAMRACVARQSPAGREEEDVLYLATPERERERWDSKGGG